MSMIVLSNIRKLYDGTSAKAEAVHEFVDLWIQEGKIEALIPHDAKRPMGAEIRRVDCSALTVTPGLIDCHGHVTISGVRSEDMDIMNSQAGLLHAERILFTTLVDGGVTTVRDVGGATHFLKRMVDEGVIIGPRLKIAICMLSTTGGHADFRGLDRCHGEISRLWPAGPGRPSSIVDGPWECRKRVREIAACGADFLKICTSPGVVSPSDKLEYRDFTQEEIEVICDEASGRGLYVAAHAHSKRGVELSIDCGVQDIQHISFMDTELAERAYARGCTVTPTSWISYSLPNASGLSPFVMEKVRQVMEVHSEAVRVAHGSGLKILAGTDPVLPNMHGRNYMELVSLIKDGLPPLVAWFGGTGLAAGQIDQQDSGKLVPGHRADLLLCKGDVIDQPELFDQGALVEVMKDGIGYRGNIMEIPQRTFGSSVRQTLKNSSHDGSISGLEKS